jgi:hypothetical protein
MINGTDRSKKPSEMQSGPYEDFLLTEYNNIAQAHFNTKNSISSFFKHYLLIVSLPIPILAVVFGKTPDTAASKSLTNSTEYSLLLNLIPCLFVIISIVGILVMLYIVNLGFNASLYARVVNGIRSYFTKRSGLSPEEEVEVRVLPVDIRKPRFTGFHSMLFVVLAFAFIDSFYFALAVAAGSGLSTALWDLSEWKPLVCYVLVFSVHVVLYLGYAKYKERKF